MTRHTTHFEDLAAALRVWAKGLLSTEAAVDFEAVACALQAGELPCASSEVQVLRLAMSSAAGMPVDLGGAVPGLDAANAGLVADAVLRAAGHRDLMVRGAW